MRGRGPVRARRAPAGQHVLADRALAADLVRNAGVTSADLILEIGAGTGVLTEPLAARARAVVAVELDPDLAARLSNRFAGEPRVRVMAGDALRVPLPAEPYRVVANLPFAITTAILHRLLDDPAGPLLRADIIVQWHAALKRANPLPATLLTLSWAPWFEFTVTRRIPAAKYRPPPAVDTGVLTITRRPDPLLDPSERAGYLALLRRGFTRANAPLRRALPGAGDASRALGVPSGARPVDLDAAQWTHMYRLIHDHRA